MGLVSALLWPPPPFLWSSAFLAEAQEAAQRERDRASSEIETAKAAALQEIAQRSVDVALSLASDMVRRQLNKDDHDQLIRDALDRFPSNN